MGLQALRGTKRRQRGTFVGAPKKDMPGRSFSWVCAIMIAKASFNPLNRQDIGGKRESAHRSGSKAATADK